MRITKKFAGSNGIGKQIFSPSLDVENLEEVRKSIQLELEDLERKFFKRIDYSMSANPVGSRPLISSEEISVQSQGYRIALPSETANVVPMSYSEVLSFISNKKTEVKIETISTIAPSLKIPTLTLNGPIAVPKQSSVKQQIADVGYVNDKYRIVGFEYLKKDVSIKPEPALKKEKLSIIGNSSLLAKKPASKSVSAKAAKASEKKLQMDPTLDLQASALLLDFFRSAQSKECPFDSNNETAAARSSDSEADSLSPNTYEGYRVHLDDIDKQESKKLRLI
jgi:hypothetical protein